MRKFDLALETDADLPTKKNELSADEETKKKEEEAIKRNNLAMHSLTIALSYSRGILHIKAGFKGKWDETGQQGLASDVMKSLKKKFIGRNVLDTSLLLLEFITFIFLEPLHYLNLKVCYMLCYYLYAELVQLLNAYNCLSF